jgi:uncharacterized caspase-like protein
MTRMRLALVTALLVVLNPWLAHAADLRGVALVIGEGEYANLPPLANPPNDARDIGDLLSDLGFDVTSVGDADGKKLGRAFERFAEDAADADVALVYYSGHGIEAAGENYLVPVDADIATPETAGASLVPVGTLLDALAKTVPVTIVLLDACRTDPFPAGQTLVLPGAAGPVVVDGVGLAAVRGPTPAKRGDLDAESLGMVIGFAAEPGEAALDGAPGENSPYAAALIKHFSASGTSLGDIMTMVTEEVYLKTKAQQLPWTNSSLRRVLSFGEAPEATGTDDALIRDGRRALLMSISTAPEATRRSIEQLASTEGVPLDALYGMLKVLGVDTAADRDPTALEAQLKSGADRLRSLMEQRTGAAKSDSELLRLSGLADRAETEGAIDVALKFRQQATERADALEINVEANEANLRQDRLQIGATYAEHAHTAALNFDQTTAIVLWKKAIGQVDKWDAVLAAGYRNNLGVALTEQGMLDTDAANLEEAAQALATALEGFPRDERPLDWARAQSNLGNVLQILGDREQDPSRYEAAASAHLAALEELTAERVPLDWATAENNLGIALARIGEREEGVDTLSDAVDAFQAALEVRTVESAPADWAATMNNLASALASIGVRQEGTETLEQAARAFEAVLEGRPRETSPVQWARTMRNLGVVSRRLGERTEGTEWFDRSADCYRDALGVFTEDKTPRDWGQANATLGFVLMARAERVSDRASLEEARAAFENALRILGNDPQMAEAFYQRIDAIDAVLGNTP